MPSESASSPEVAFERRLLLGVQDVAGGHQKDDGPVPGEVRPRERRGVLVASTVSPFRAPSSRTARSAVGMEACRNPDVFEDEDPRLRVSGAKGFERRPTAAAPTRMIALTATTRTAQL